MLELPHQMSDAVTGGSSVPEVMLFIKKARELLDKFSELPYLEGIPVSVTVQFEKAFDGILTFSKKNKIDLIVMGSHGASGLHEMLVGSNTEKVVRLSNVPVLVIKKDVGKFKVETIVFASDFSAEIKKPFQKMIEFAEIFNSNLILVMICTPNSFRTTKVAEKIMSNFIDDFKIKNYTTHIYNDTNIENGILNFTNSINGDLIGMCTHQRTGLSHFFNGSISEDLVNHAAKPVITFKI